MSQTNPQKKKYRVNLPQTPFPMKASLATREPERLQHWQDKRVETRLLEKQRQAPKKFILHDGPPYANGHIHIGHALNKTLKDMIVKFRTMQGYNTYYVPGWDCHGLPIEHQCLKEMGKRKDQVERVPFRMQARQYAEKFVNIQKEEFKRLGIFGDWENPYLTMNYSYQSAIVKSFWEIYEKGFVEQRLKPVPWCFDCETALADAELEYADRRDEAVYVGFEVTAGSAELQALKKKPELGGKPVFVLVWTTTPWTLPANVGLAFNPELTYALAVTSQGNFIFAEALEETLKNKMGWQQCAIVQRWKASALPFEAARHPFLERDSRKIDADYVSATDGTGVVHIAPGHGEDDYLYGNLKAGLDILSPVDEKGRFFEDEASGFVKAFPDYQNAHVFKANKRIISEILEPRNRLFFHESYPHSYPHCWRCKNPILFRATPQWFMKVDHEGLRQKLTNAIQKDIRFTPDWGKNRIGSMIESRPDWCLSRQRLWGVPIPVAVDKKSGKVHLTESFKKRVLEIFEKEGADAWFRRPVEDFFPDEPERAKNLTLEQDILDVWFDSGVSHQAVLESGHELGFPCELYLEGSDQHRGWFQTSLITAMAMRGTPPFRQVLTHGFVVDGQGKKMSKSQGNVVSPQDVMKQYGADILRLWVSSCDINQDVRMSPEILERMAEAYRKIRNTFRYLLGNLGGFDPAAHRVPDEKLNSIDQWVLTRLHEVADEVTTCYEEYRFHRIYQILYEFCINDLSAFYLDAQKDRLYCDHPDAADRRSAQTALFRIAQTLARLVAPILVFTSDEIWQSFPLGSESTVHEAEWDKKLWAYQAESSRRQWDNVRAVRSHTDLRMERMREAKEIGSSLDCRVELSTASKELKAWLQAHCADLTLGLIVSEIALLDQAGEGDSVELEWEDEQGKVRKDNLVIRVQRAEGKKCGRCWKYTPEVGTLEDPVLCRRCQDVETRLAVTPS